MIFLAKELKAYSHNDKSHFLSPSIIAHLNLDTVDSYEFIDPEEEEVEDQKEMTVEKLIERSMKMAASVPSEAQRVRKEQKILNEDITDEEKQKKLKILRQPIQTPSLMRLYCNIFEILRLREQIYSSAVESQVLQEHYQKQLRLGNRDRFNQTQSINFETNSLTKGKLNYVDQGEGSNQKLELAFQEFDSTLENHFHLSNTESFQILMTDLGVEEVRAILMCQKTQYTALVTAVNHNQALLDGGEKALAELQFLQQNPPFMVPSPSIALHDMLSKNVEGYNHEMYNKEKSRVSLSLTKDAGENLYQIESKKLKGKSQVAKRYQTLSNRMGNSEYNLQAQLRVLRSYRIRLCHSYCHDLLKEFYQDSIKTQLILTVNQLRYKINLLPRDTIGRQRVFELKLSTFLENCS